SASWDRTVKLWDVAAWQAGGGTPTVRTLQGHKQKVRAAAFSPDGKLLATGGEDQTVRLWDAATGAAAGDVHRAGGGDRGQGIRVPPTFPLTPPGRRGWPPACAAAVPLAPPSPPQQPPPGTPAARAPGSVPTAGTPGGRRSPSCSCAGRS